MPNWKREPSPKDIGYGGGWLLEMDHCWRQGRKYLAMSRMVQTAWGLVRHVCIRNQDCTDIPWAEKQRIKNELFGRNAVAIEVFPAEERLVDAANMYHLWILPDGFQLPFGIHDDDPK